MAGAICRNLAGSHLCHCPAGEEGDGVSCCISHSFVQELRNQGQSLSLTTHSLPLSLSRCGGQERKEEKREEKDEEERQNKRQQTKER